MNGDSSLPGGSEIGTDPIQPLEPGRSDVMPYPPPDDSGMPTKEGEIPLEPTVNPPQE